jgi:hypothetical protein
MSKDPSKFDEKEAQKRFEAALRGVLNTPHKPLKEKPKKPPAPKGQVKKTAAKS